MPTTDKDLAENWPGKSPAEGCDIFHPAAYHMLDVAASAEELLTSFEIPQGAADALVLLIFLHDLGKIGNEFRDMVTGVNVDGYIYRHWELSETWLFDHQARIAAHLGIRPRALFQLIAAASGHHGRPSRRDMNDDYIRMRDRAGVQAAEDAATLIDRALALWPDADLSGMSTKETKRFSWWLAGLTSAADWIGSNQEWFPAQHADLSFDAYLDEARVKARAAVSAAGMATTPVSTDRLFDFELRPMQKAAQDIPLPEGPCLAIIEDETGAGKTEAALLLSQRMLAAGKGLGLFFALPTMATSDAMYSRMRQVIGKMFVGTPNLALAHGRAHLSREFRATISNEARGDSDVSCTRWLADDRRKVLMADVGVGTIDQALQAVMPTAFATLRLFGLSRQILIVDEVHEMGNPYMARELEELLRLHAMRGGSAILATATLPLDLRRRLVEAFNKGAEIATAPDLDDPSYPALTLSCGETITNFPRTASAKGPVRVQRIGSQTEAIDRVVHLAKNGACTLWVRNAVDDAIAAVHALRARGIRARLLHARFTLFDRKTHERDIMKIFGKEGQDYRHKKDGTAEVLVATQVVESSLDIDFDAVVSDLAPMAALIQRAGRLWRHMDKRPREDRPVAEPVLYLLSPLPRPDVTGKWLDNVMPKGRWVYPLHDQWRTAHVLLQRGQITAPDDLRGLIEAVHGPDACPLPEELIKAEERRNALDDVEAGRAAHRIIDVEEGYRAGGDGEDGEQYPTRLGRPTITIHLLRKTEPEVVTWARRVTPAYSELQVPLHRLLAIDNLPRIPDDVYAAHTEKWTHWKKRGTRVFHVPKDGRICAGLRYDRKYGLLFE
ncbi:CRISPR-associated helicase Cas3' [Sulfitobacter sp. 1A13353]|uniref:CRISPR-associated helicase Cas3' n=1 Tax=Sulfitobacter sp. 1A13353 TaxID=3368568 RepID=UPI0037456047